MPFACLPYWPTINASKPRRGCPLTFLREVVLLCVSLHVLTPAFHPLCLRVQELHKPRAVPPARRHPPGVRCLDGRLQPGVRRRQVGSVHGGPVVFSVTEEPLGPNSSHGPVLGRCAGLWMPLEGGPKLQAFVLHGDVSREALQLQVRLDGGGHAVGTLETPVSAEGGGKRKGRLSERTPCSKPTPSSSATCLQRSEQITPGNDESFPFLTTILVFQLWKNAGFCK